MTTKKLLFSITANDCNFQAFKASGPGGQHRNKTSTAIRCTHVPSGAVGVAKDDKSQHRNKKKAFGRMARSAKMQEWIRIEAAKRTGLQNKVNQAVEKQMNPHFLKTEIHDDFGLWVTAPNGMEDNYQNEKR